MKNKKGRKKIALKFLPLLIQDIICLSLLINHRKVDIKNIKKIIIPSYTGLGNFILKTPMIKALNNAFPKAKITILAGGHYGAETVLKGSDLASEIKTFKLDSSILEKIKFAFELRKEKYDVILLPFDASPPFLRIFSLFAGIPMRIGHHYKEVYDADPWIRLYTHPVALKAGRHEIDLNLDLLVPLGVKNVKDKKTYFSLPDRIDTSHLLPWDSKKEKYMCVQLGAANAQITPKRWYPERFSKVLDKIIDKYDMPIVALGDKNEVFIFEEVQNKMKNKLINCVGKSSIEEAAQIIKNSCLLLGHDSGLMHVSIALDTPVVVIWGPTDYTRTGPIGSMHSMIRKDLECSPCMYAFSKTEEEVALDCKNRDCMKLITVDDVVDEISKKLDKNA